MMTFCKKSVHSFLGLANSMENVFLSTSGSSTPPPPPPPPPPLDYSSYSYYRSPSSSPHDSLSPLVGGLGFIAVSRDVHRPANVVESAAVKTPAPPKRDPGGIGFIDEVGGGVDGLMSCTESLGFESSDERRVDDEIKCCYEDAGGWRSKPLMVRSPWRNSSDRREPRKFPPPLPSLNHNGQPTFFLRPLRKDGRLELTEVRIDRPEILRASRQDGRLTLHLVKEEDDADEDEPPRQEEVLQMEKYQEEDDGIEEEEEEEEEETEEEEENDDVFDEKVVVAKWQFKAASGGGGGGGGEGLRRCHELVQRHHHLHGWSQPCVTSR